MWDANFAPINRPNPGCTFGQEEGPTPPSRQWRLLRDISCAVPGILSIHWLLARYYHRPSASIPSLERETAGTAALLHDFPPGPCPIPTLSKRGHESTSPNSYNLPTRTHCCGPFSPISEHQCCDSARFCPGPGRDGAVPHRKPAAGASPCGAMAPTPKRRPEVPPLAAAQAQRRRLESRHGIPMSRRPREPICEARTRIPVSVRGKRPGALLYRWRNTDTPLP